MIDKEILEELREQERYWQSNIAQLNKRLKFCEHELVRVKRLISIVEKYGEVE